MENIAFVLWMVLWPIAECVSDYIVAKRRAITKEPEYSKETKAFSAVAFLMIWILVAKALYV